MIFDTDVLIWVQRGNQKAADATIAATATENNLPLCSGNAKHYRAIQELQLRVFRP